MPVGWDRCRARCSDPIRSARSCRRLPPSTSKPYNVNFFVHKQPTPDSAREDGVAQGAGAVFRRVRNRSGSDSSRARRACRLMTPPPTCSKNSSRRSSAFISGCRRLRWCKRVKSWGSKILSSATTLDEARYLEAHGVDAIIAQGYEAGGHRGMFLTEDLSTQVGTFALVQQIVTRGHGAGDRRRRYRRRERGEGGDGARRGRSAGRHRVSVLPGSDDQSAAPRGA